MADNALEFVNKENLFPEKLNRKTLFVGNGTQITNIVNTYPGQIAFCTVTGGAFTADKYYKRNAANDAWLEAGGYESEELSSTPVTDNSQSSTAVRQYMYFTLPSTYDWYLITKIEWKNGTAVSGIVETGVDIVDAEPPTAGSASNLVAFAQRITQAGTSTTQSSNVLWCKPLRAGTLIGAWIVHAGSPGNLRTLTGQPSQNYQSNAGPTTAPATVTYHTWTGTTQRFYLKIYYRGYSIV